MNSERCTMIVLAYTNDHLVSYAPYHLHISFSSLVLAVVHNWLSVFAQSLLPIPVILSCWISWCMLYFEEISYDEREYSMCIIEVI